MTHMTTTTAVSLPPELLARMQALSQVKLVNWSAIAREAFERELERNEERAEKRRF